MLTKLPEEKKKVNVTAVPALMGRLNCSTETLSGVGETYVGVMRDVNGTHSHWEIRTYIQELKEKLSVEYLSFYLVHIQEV